MNTEEIMEELRRDRDLEKRMRKDAEHKLADAAELLENIMRGRVNAQDEAEKWLREYDPIRLRRTADALAPERESCEKEVGG